MHAISLAAIALGTLVATRFLPLDAPPLSLFGCPFRAATGWPCLFCGCTHAFAHATRLEFADAALASPLGLLLALVSALHIELTALRLYGLPLSLDEPSLGVKSRWTALGLLALNWAFVAARTRGAL